MQKATLIQKPSSFVVRCAGPEKRTTSTSVATISKRRTFARAHCRPFRQRWRLRRTVWIDGLLRPIKQPHYGVMFPVLGFVCCVLLCTPPVNLVSRCKNDPVDLSLSDDSLQWSLNAISEMWWVYCCNKKGIFYMDEILTEMEYTVRLLCAVTSKVTLEIPTNTAGSRNIHVVNSNRPS